MDKIYLVEFSYSVEVAAPDEDTAHDKAKQYLFEYDSAEALISDCYVDIEEIE